MKQFISGVALLTLLATSAQAQIAPGTILMGGSLGYSTQNREGSLGYTDTDVELDKTSQLNLSPTAGYFVTENLALGLSVDYSVSKSTQYQYLTVLSINGAGPVRIVENGQTESRTRSLGIGPMARYYTFLGDKAAFFGQLGAGYQSLRVENSSSATGIANGYGALTTGSGFYAQLAPGFAFFPTDKFGLEVSLRGLTYQRSKRETNGTDPSKPSPYPQKSTTSTFDAGFGLSSLQLGGAFYLGR